MSDLAHHCYGCCALLVYFVIYPFALIWLKETRPEWFVRSGRFLVVLGEFVVSWCFTMGVILVSNLCGWGPLRGPEVAFASLFGWLYMPLAGLPIGIVYSLLKLGERRKGPAKAASAKRRRAIAIAFVVVMCVSCLALAFLPRPEDMVSAEFAWLLNRSDFQYEPLRKETSFIQEYKVDVDFAKRLCRMDLGAYGFDGWETVEGGCVIGGYRVEVSLFAHDGEIMRARKCERRQVGAGQREVVLAEIYVDTKNGRLVLYCPHDYW